MNSEDGVKIDMNQNGTLKCQGVKVFNYFPVVQFICKDSLSMAISTF